MLLFHCIYIDTRTVEGIVVDVSSPLEAHMDFEDYHEAHVLARRVVADMDTVKFDVD